MEHFSEDQKKRARKADLYEFLMANHAELFKRDGDSIHPRDNGSLSIKRGYCGYKDFATDETGNSIDFLVKHLGYQIDDAIFALLGETSADASNGSVSSRPATTTKTSEPEKKEPPTFPEEADGAFRNLFAYLKFRGISQDTIQTLIDKKLIYQEKAHNNIVFANGVRDWGELHGTYTQGEKTFHGMVRNSRMDGFWSMKSGEMVKVVYICEAAIDAISLYELHRLDGRKEEAAFVSIGGVAKQPAIDRIKKKYRVIMAVDNDAAGSECRKRNAELESIIPHNKDWNEDLLERLGAKLKEPDPVKVELKNEDALDSVSVSDVKNEKIPGADGILPNGKQDPYGAEHAIYVWQMMEMTAT